MLWLAYIVLALSVIAVLWRREKAQNAMRGSRGLVIRLGFAAVSAAFLVIAIGALIEFAGEPQQALSKTPIAWAIFGTLSLGGALYTTGILWWQGAVAYYARVFGWILLMLALLVPSQATLALPFAAVLAVSLVPADEDPPRAPRSAGPSRFTA